MSDKAIRIECEAADLIELDELSGFQGELKALSDEDRAKLRNVILEYGFSAPIIAWRDADKRHVLDGHQRMKVLHGLREEGYSIPPLPVAWVAAGSKAEAKRKLLTIASSYGRTTREGLDAFLEEIAAPLLDIVPEVRLPDLPSVAETPTNELEAREPEEVERVSERGDLWELGGHRLMNGDSTSAEDVAKLTSGQTAALCFTSPPYLDQRTYESGPAHPWDALMDGVFDVAPMRDDAQLLVNLGMVYRQEQWVAYWDAWLGRMSQRGWRRYGWYVWDQGSGMPSGNLNGRLAPSFEFLFHLNKKARKPEKWMDTISGGTRRARPLRREDGAFPPAAPTTRPSLYVKIPDAVWRITRASGRPSGHPAPFPVELALYAIRSWPGVVYEPFGGAGTTLIAAEMAGHKCLSMEVEPLYVDLAVARYRDWCAANDREAVVKRNGQLIAS